MGDYRQAVEDYFAGLTPTPEITSVEKYGTLKYGFGINLEQDVTPNFRVAGRFGWNEGQHDLSPTQKMIRHFSSAQIMPDHAGIANSIRSALPS